MTRVLIVEDEPAVADGLRRLLERRGVDVALAGTVGEALGSLSPPPDHVLLDLMLPDGPGERVLDAARQHAPDARVIVTTGVTDPLRLAQVSAMAPHAVLSKPVELMRLLALLGV